MLKLEQIAPHARVQGILPGQTVEVVHVQWFGPDILEVIYRASDGQLMNQIIDRSYEARLAGDNENNGALWSFNGNGDTFILASEALRIKLAHLYDPILAVHTSNIEPLPHQITAVYATMLNRQPLRFLLADDPGAGKTIMAGLLIKELMVRGDLVRCLVVCPGSLAEQWQDELLQRFHLHFSILTNEGLQAAASNWFLENNLAIARLDKLSRNPDLQDKLRVPECRYDLIICDEAHKMSASYYGGEISYTKRFQLGRALSAITRHFLLMTATPHNGKDEDFQLFLSLLDPDRFEGKARTRDNAQPIDTSDIMRRMIKEELLKFDGTPLFPPRIAYSLPFRLSDLEAKLYSVVTDYVKTEFNRAEKIQDTKRTRTVGFALTVLQRRLASSPEAICQSLVRRHARLEKKLHELEQERQSVVVPVAEALFDIDLDELEDAPDFEVAEVEEEILDEATAATTIAELKAEIETLAHLEALAYQVRKSGTDTKWRELSGLIQELLAHSRTELDPLNFKSSSAGVSQAEPGYGAGDIPPPIPSHKEKIVIFTEHRDTLNYLKSKITTLVGRHEAVVTIHGSMSREERARAQAAFKNDPAVQILVATDAAGEGINLQRAHLMVNYDLPWNPNRLEQRFGRIHRIGQTEICYLWNLVAEETREGDVYKTLLTKLEEARKSLGGRVFDVLGKLQFDGKPLRELLIQAIREGDNPEIKAQITHFVGQALDKDALAQLLEEKALVHDAMDVSKVMKIREDMERADARRLQPYYIRQFFMQAFKNLGGSIYGREPGRYEITHVPASLRSTDRVIGTRDVVLQRYQRVTFEKELIRPEGKIEAEFLCPGAPLLDALIEVTLAQSSSVLKQGAVLVDEQDASIEPKVVFFLEHAIQDATTTPRGDRHIVSKRILHLRIDKMGAIQDLDYAPYLDYRPLSGSEPSVQEILARPECSWITKDLEQSIRMYAVTTAGQEHLAEVQANRLALLTKTEHEVKERLSREIRYWDKKAADLKAQEAAGKPAAHLNSLEAQRRADELQTRLEKRLAKLQLEKELSSVPPVVLGGYLVVPIGLLAAMKGTPLPVHLPQETQESAARARAVVMERERELGYEPIDREFEKVGWDIESKVPGTGQLRFIEVKGRVEGQDYITVTKNEILHSLNKPDSYILAIVQFKADGSHTLHYVTRPFTKEPDLGERTRNYDIQMMLEKGTRQW